MLIITTTFTIPLEKWSVKGSTLWFSVGVCHENSEDKSTWHRDSLARILDYFKTSDLSRIFLDTTWVGDVIFAKVVLAFKDAFEGIIDSDGKIYSALVGGNAVNEDYFLTDFGPNLHVEGR